MPPGAITIDAARRHHHPHHLLPVHHRHTGPSHGLGELTGVTVTVAIHWWRHNAVLSIVTGTAACLMMTNWGPPV